MQKSNAYHRLSNKFCGICSHQLKSARKQRLNLDKKDYQSIYYCCPKQQRLFAVNLYKQEPENTKSVACVYH